MAGEREMSATFAPLTRILCTLAAPLLLFLLLTAQAAHAEVLQAPFRARPFPLGDGRVACAPASGGWSVEWGGRAVRPPSDEEAVGRAVELQVAPNAAACATASKTVTLVTTGRWPTFDAASIVFLPDDGRLEATGSGLQGVKVVWRSGTNDGVDVCLDPKREGRSERCAWAVGPGTPADAASSSLAWLPSGARPGEDAVFIDAFGDRASRQTFTLTPARLIITRVVPTDATVDLGTGQGEVPLVHPEAVGSAECAPLACEMSDGKLLVRGASSLVKNVDIKLRFRPHVFLLRNEALESQTTVRLPVLHCPMWIVSGQPVRNNDDAKVIVKLEGACARDLGEVRFLHEQTPLKVLRVVSGQDATFVLLRLGDFDDDSLTITALRGPPDEIALAVAHISTRSTPQVRATLSLPDFPNLSFIPTNREARVHISPAGEHQHFTLLPIEGVYSVRYEKGQALVRATPMAAGLTALRFGLRSEDLPGALGEVDLAVLSDPLQRGTGEANVPAPLETEVLGPKPLIEVLCGGDTVPLERLKPGVTAHLSFSLRDTCRVVFHRERLPPELGSQKINFEIDVLRADGSPRGEARVSEVITLRSGSGPRAAWIRGVSNPFDRIIVRVSHVADENHYIGASEIKTGAPAAQWSAVLGTGRARLYATTAIPTGLYRFGDKEHSGVLQLNFGVISRLTWLDAEGHEGFLGAEAGVLVFGLANSQSETGRSLTQVGGVIGLGVSVPIANRSSVTQASINLHAWLEADITRASDSGSRYGFIFGPSISIGNVGLNL